MMTESIYTWMVSDYENMVHNVNYIAVLYDDKIKLYMDSFRICKHGSEYGTNA